MVCVESDLLNVEGLGAVNIGNGHWDQLKFHIHLYFYSCRVQHSSRVRRSLSSSQLASQPHARKGKYGQGDRIPSGGNSQRYSCDCPECAGHHAYYSENPDISHWRIRGQCCGNVTACYRINAAVNGC